MTHAIWVDEARTALVQVNQRSEERPAENHLPYTFGFSKNRAPEHAVEQLVAELSLQLALVHHLSCLWTEPDLDIVKASHAKVDIECVNEPIRSAKNRIKFIDSEIQDNCDGVS